MSTLRISVMIIVFIAWGGIVSGFSLASRSLPPYWRPQLLTVATTLAPGAKNLNSNIPDKPPKKEKWTPFVKSSNFRRSPRPFQSLGLQSNKSVPRSVYTRKQSTYGSSEWRHLLMTWPHSSILRRVRGPVICVSAWTFALALFRFARQVSSGVRDSGALRGLTHVLLFGENPSEGLSKALSLAAGFLSLLLVFRTNTANQRFWDGHKIWKTMSSLCRSMATFTEIYADEFGAERVQRVSEALVAFPLSLQLHLEGGIPDPTLDDPEAEVRDLFNEFKAHPAPRRRHSGGRPLQQEQVVPYQIFQSIVCDNDDLAAKFCIPTDIDLNEALKQLHLSRFNGEHRPDDSPGVSLRELESYYSPLRLRRMLPTSENTPLHIIRSLLHEGKGVAYRGDLFGSRERLAWISMVDKLQTCIGAAEFITETPMPFHYVRFTSRFLSAWCLALPFCLVRPMGFLAVPMMAIVTWSLFGLREIGYLIENPFRRSLQMTLVTDQINADIIGILDDVLQQKKSSPPEGGRSKLLVPHHPTDLIHSPTGIGIQELFPR